MARFETPPDNSVDQPDFTQPPSVTPPLPNTARATTSPQRQLLQRWRPPSFEQFHKQLTSDPEQTSRDLDAALQRAYSNAYTLENQIASTQLGSTVVTGSKTNIPTGLAVVRECHGSIDAGSAAHNFWLTVRPSQNPNSIDIFVWQPTAAGDNTPIACTTAVTVRWIATGTLAT